MVLFEEEVEVIEKWKCGLDFEITRSFLKARYLASFLHIFAHTQSLIQIVGYGAGRSQRQIATFVGNSYPHLELRTTSTSNLELRSRSSTTPRDHLHSSK
jgi:hypothetical protein